MVLITVNTNIGVVHIHIISQIPIIGSNMITNRFFSIIETQTKRYCALLGDQMHIIPYLQLKRPKDGPIEVIFYGSGNTSHINEKDLLLKPSKRIPSNISFCNNNSIPSIKINFVHCQIDEIPINFEPYEKLTYEFQFIAYEYDNQSTETNFENQKLTNMILKLLNIEPGIHFTSLDEQTKESSMIDSYKTDNLLEKK